MKHVDERIQAFLDGELTPAEALALQEHVRSCAACRRELERRRGLWARVDILAGQPMPEISVWPRLQERLARRGSAGGTWSARGLALAAMLAGVFIGWQLGRPDATLESGDDLVAEADYLVDSQPSLDQLWIQIAANGETES